MVCFLPGARRLCPSLDVLHSAVVVDSLRCWIAAVLVMTAPAIAEAQQFVYALNPLSVSGFNANIFTGALTPVPGSPFALQVTADRLIADRSGRFLYVAESASIATGFIAGFAINPFNGALIALPGRYALAGSGVSLIIDPSNRFLYAVTTSNLNVFAIDPFTGALTPTAGSPFGFFQGSMRGAVMDPSGRFLYGTDRTSIQGYAIDSFTGEPILVTSHLIREGSSGDHTIVMHPNGLFLYATETDQTVGQGVWMFTINPVTGALARQLLPPPPLPPIPCASLAIEPTGRFLYCGRTEATNEIVTYSLGFFDGTPLPLRSLPFPEGSSVLKVDPTGRAVLATPPLSVPDGGAISVLAIDFWTGILNPVAGSPFATGLPQASIDVAVTGISWLALLFPQP